MKDSGVGCLEARLADALTYLADPKAIKLMDLFQHFYSELNENEQTFIESLIPRCVQFFGSRMPLIVLTDEGEAKPLTMALVSEYLQDKMGQEDAIKLFEENAYLQLAKIKPEVVW